MSIPYRHKRIINRVGTILLVLLLVLIVTWLCWVVWLQRYVVYTSDGAELSFDVSSYDITGKQAVEPKAEANISIFYNEGADAINTSNDMEQIVGYYITSEMFQSDYDNIALQLERLKAGTAVMIDMKGSYGSFFYQSKLPDAIPSASTNLDQVASLVKKMQTKGFYTIARISAFRDYNYGLNHVPSGLYLLSRKGLWADSEGMYWLDPTNATTTSWITSVVLELKEMGFDEVLLDNFCFPDSQNYIFNGDKPAALQAAASTLMSTCGSSDFVLSFTVSDPAFPLPEGRCRKYISGIPATGINSAISQSGLEEPEIGMVFLSDSGDTRYDKYSVLRNLNVAEEVEARKAG